MKKTYRIKTNNQEQLQRKQNESDATSRWIEFQKTRPRRRIQDKDVPVKEQWVSCDSFPCDLNLESHACSLISSLSKSSGELITVEQHSRPGW